MSTTERCPDCQVAVGEAHDDGCDVARCLYDGGQRLMHEMSGGGVQVACVDGVWMPVHDGDDGHDCGRDVWSGVWPGKAECREFGWWVQDRCSEGLGFVPCAPDAPGAMEDLNRLVFDCDWDPAAVRWVRRATAETSG